MKSNKLVSLPGCIVLCSGVLVGCAAGVMGERPGLKGNPSCVSNQSVSLVDASGVTPAGANTVSRVQPIGGVLSIDSLLAGVNNAATTVNGKFSELKFGVKAFCSAVLEFRKQGSTFFVEALVDDYCYFPKLFLKGRNPQLLVYRNAGSGMSAGYDSLTVTLPDLLERDRLLQTIEKIPGSNDDVRTIFLDSALNSERLLAVRGMSESIKANGVPDSKLGADICAAIPEAEQSAFDTNPNSNPDDDPSFSNKPRPVNCQMIVPSRWVKFVVPDDVAAQKREWLDGLVKESDTNRNLAANSSSIDLEFKAAQADFRKLDTEAYEADINRQRLRLAFSAIRAANGGCVVATSPGGTAQNKILAGPSRSAYIDLAKTLVAADMHPLIDRLRAHQCTEDADSAAYRAKIEEATAASDAKFLELARVLGRLQSLMKAKKEQVGIATNHIRNLTGSEVAIEFKDLPLFPAGGAVATELQRHTFNFDNPWLSATFDRTKAHPGANNLRTDFNDGYAITFGGVPVGAVSAMTDESGGVAAIPLPERKPVAAKAPSSDPNGNAGPGEAERNRADQKSVPVADCK
jgi:hypothetical protein